MKVIGLIYIKLRLKTNNFQGNCNCKAASSSHPHQPFNLAQKSLYIFVIVCLYVHLLSKSLVYFLPTYRLHATCMCCYFGSSLAWHISLFITHGQLLSVLFTLFVLLFPHSLLLLVYHHNTQAHSYSLYSLTHLVSCREKRVSFSCLHLSFSNSFSY